MLECGESIFWEYVEDQYHFVSMIGLMMLQAAKIWLLYCGHPFLRYNNFVGPIIFESTVGLVSSIRFMSLFTISFLSKAATTDPEPENPGILCQYFVLKCLPYVLCLLDSYRAYASRQFFTLDDLMCAALFCLHLQFTIDFYEKVKELEYANYLRKQPLAEEVERLVAQDVEVKEAYDYCRELDPCSLQETIE